MYHKMQREKLYNLQRTAYFNCLFFLFKKSKILYDQFSTLRKNRVFRHKTRILFSYFIFSSLNTLQ